MTHCNETYDVTQWIKNSNKFFYEIFEILQHANMISSIQNSIRPHRSLEHIVRCVNVRQKMSIKRTCWRLDMLKMYLLMNLILLLTPTSSVASHDPWGENLQPKLHTDYLNQYSGMLKLATK